MNEHQQKTEKKTIYETIHQMFGTVYYIQLLIDFSMKCYINMQPLYHLTLTERKFIGLRLATITNPKCDFIMHWKYRTSTSSNSHAFTLALHIIQEWFQWPCLILDLEFVIW